MSKGVKITLIIVGIIILGLFILGGSLASTYNGFVRGDEGVKNAWAQVENQYQRRFDLIPNLVETVKGYASHEQETLTAITEARAKMGGMVKLPPEAVNDPALMAKYQQAQAGLGSALQRLMVVVEKYPDLKANQNFLELQAQLEGTENRISTERRRFNDEVKNYNISIRKFPGVMLAGMFGFKPAVMFEAKEGAEEAPKVQF